MKHILIATFFLLISLFHQLSLAELSAEDMGTFLKQSVEEQRQAREAKKEIAHYIKNNPLKIAYTILDDSENDRICYIEAFNNKDVVPDFAKPATYEEALSIPKPSVPKCSDEELNTIISYRDSSVLLDDGIELAGFPLVPVAGAFSIGLLRAIPMCLVASGTSYLLFSVSRLSEFFSILDHILEGKEVEEREISIGLWNWVLGLIGVFKGSKWFGKQLNKLPINKTPARFLSAGLGGTAMLACSVGGMGVSLYHFSVVPLVEEFIEEQGIIKPKDFSIMEAGFVEPISP